MSKLEIYTGDEDDPDKFLSTLFDASQDIRKQHGDLIVKVFYDEDCDLRAQSQDGRFNCILDGNYYATKPVIQTLRESKDEQAFFSAYMTPDKTELVLMKKTSSNLGW